MGDFLMPSLGADMEAGTLLEWCVKPGDTVERGDIVAVVDTSKAEIEVEIFESGVIDQLLVAEGTRVPVGTVLATVRTAAESSAVAAAAAPPAAVVAPSLPQPAPAVPVETAARAAAPSSSVRHGVRASPLARSVAAQLGVDLNAVSGTGPGGAITRDDVERLAPSADVAALTPVEPPPAEPPPAEPPPVEPPPIEPPAQRTAAVQPPSGSPAASTPEVASREDAMRQAIGALMARSKREIPHYYLQLEIDLGDALEWLHETNLTRGVQERILPSALMLSAVAHAAAEMPEMNGFWIDGAFVAASGVHLGVAVSLRGGGLIAPALHDADAKSVEELMAGVRDLVVRARTGRLRSSEMSDPTLTVTNLGDRGVNLVHGVIYPPQVALVGFGAIRERPWATEGLLGVRPTVIATLAADHRASDGHTGGLFLSLIDHRLQKPEEL